MKFKFRFIFANNDRGKQIKKDKERLKSKIFQKIYNLFRYGLHKKYELYIIYKITFHSNFIAILSFFY